MIPEKTPEQRLAALELESKRLESQFDHDHQMIMAALAVKYGPKRRAIEAEMKLLRDYIRDHMGAVEQYRWKVLDRQNHDTDIDTTKRMKRSLRREQDRRANATARKSGRRGR